MVRPMVHSTKHYVQTSIATVVAGAKLDIILAQAVSVANKNLVQEVEEGAKIKAIYLEYWIRSSEVSPGSGICAFYKDPGGGLVFTTTELAAMGNAENKKNVFFFQQGLFNDQDADAISVVRQWFKVPKSKQRMGLGDRLIFSVFAQGAIDLVICGMTTYKEYT